MRLKGLRQLKKSTLDKYSSVTESGRFGILGMTSTLSALTTFLKSLETQTYRNNSCALVILLSPEYHFSP
jgi:hypothetical protein